MCIQVYNIPKESLDDTKPVPVFLPCSLLFLLLLLYFPPLEWIYELLEAILSMGFFSVIVLNPSFKCLSELPSDHLINAAGPVG